MARQNAVTPLGELAEILNSINDEEGSYVEMRPRTSSSERAWVEVEDPEKHPWNTEQFNYRFGEAPEFRVIKGEVLESENNEGISEKDAIKITRAARKCVEKDEKLDYGKVPNKDGGDPYEVNIEADGTVHIGCKEIDFEDLEEIAKKYGW